MYLEITPCCFTVTKMFLGQKKFNIAYHQLQIIYVNVGIGSDYCDLVYNVGVYCTGCTGVCSLGRMETF